MITAPVKRKKMNPMRLPVGEIVRFTGDDWLDHITGQLAIVVKHGYDNWGDRCVFLQLSHQTLEVPYEMMSIEDFEVIK